MGASGGEGFDIGKYWFTIRDTKSGLSALYLFHGYGAGISVLPASVANGGKASHFTTKDDVRVTNFGPTAGMLGATGERVFREIPNSLTFLTVQYRPDGSSVGKPTFPIKIDTGSVEIPGANINGAHFELLSLCGKGAGATRHVITRGSLVGWY